MNGKQAKKQRKVFRRSADEMNKVLSLAGVQDLHNQIKELKKEIANCLCDLAKENYLYYIYYIYNL